jgi:hypothetical protein
VGVGVASAEPNDLYDGKTMQRAEQEWWTVCRSSGAEWTLCDPREPGAGEGDRSERRQGKPPCPARYSSRTHAGTDRRRRCESHEYVFVLSKTPLVGHVCSRSRGRNPLVFRSSLHVQNKPCRYNGIRVVRCKFWIGNLRISCFILEARRCAAPTTRIQLQRFRLDFTQAHAHSRLHQSVSLRTVLRAPLPSRIGHSPRHRKSG